MSDAHPARVRSSSGVAGADLVMSQVERRLTAILRTRPREAVVVNDERRVLAANTARAGSWAPAGHRAVG
ncbi:MAG: hypothetical protein R2734_16505 [Nocardioides sp.]